MIFINFTNNKKCAVLSDRNLVSYEDPTINRNLYDCLFGFNPETTQHNKTITEIYNDKSIRFELNTVESLFTFFDIHFIEETKKIVIVCKQSTIDDMQKNNVDNISFYVEKWIKKNKWEVVPIKLFEISLNFPSNEVKENVFTPINSDYDSFMLIRTNPKLTGNIKLVVDSEDNIYLDTIKVPTLSILNEQQYRHQAISDKGDYAHDVYTVFKTLPEGVLFNPGTDKINPYTVYTDINDNYETLYEYGSETNNDLLYSESLKIFAPLYLGKKVPDYFCVFRNIPVPHENLSFDNDEELKSLIKKSEIVKIFDLRQHTNIGNYLTAYHHEINNQNPEMCNLSFIDQDNKGEIAHVGRNSWNGIAVDKGIITNKVETTYFATDIIENKTQDDFNIFLLNGFERNNLIYPRILNLEFMFNDDNADEYKIYNYFGFYLSENEFVHLNQVYTDYNENDIKVYLDKNNEKLDIYDVKYNFDIISDEKFDDRLFFATSPHDVTNISNINDIQIFMGNNVCDKPLKSICNIDGDKIIPEENVKSFMTLYFSELLKAGEHIKFIFQPKNEDLSLQYTTSNTKSATNNEEEYKSPIIFEIIMSNDAHLKTTKHYISPRIMTNDNTDGSSAYAHYYRMTCYVDDDNNVLASLSELIERIKHCINKFNSPYLHIEASNGNSIGLTSTLFDVEVQHILSMIPTEDDDIEDIVDPLKYFNKTFDNEILTINELEDSPESLYTNFAFEIVRNRYYTKEYFRNITNGYYYQIHDNLKDRLNDVKFPIVRTTNGYSALQNIDNDELTIISPFNPDMYMIHSMYEIELLNGYINVCAPLYASISIMGIYGVKDFEMNESTRTEIEVSQSQIVNFEPDEDIELDEGYIYKLLEGELKSIKHEKNAFIFKNENTFSYTSRDDKTNEVSIKSINKLQALTNVSLLKTIRNYENYEILTSYKPGISYDNYYNSDKSQLTISIVPQVNFTWKSTSQYFDKNSYLDTELLKEDSVNYLGDFNKKFGALDFTTQNALRKFVKDNNIQTALCHYNSYINKLTFTYYGIQFIWNINNKGNVNTINLQQLNNYEIAFVNNYNSENKNNIYISHKEQLIVVEIHSYDLWNQIRYNNVTFVDDTSIRYEDYNIFELPYHYNIETSAINTNVYDINKVPADPKTIFYGFYQKNKDIEIAPNIMRTTEFVEHDKLFEHDAFMYDLTVCKSNNYFDVSKMTKPQLKNFVDIVTNELDSEFNHSAEKHLYAIRFQNNTMVDDNKQLVKNFDINTFVFNYVDENEFGISYDKGSITSVLKMPNTIKYQSDNFMPSFKNIIEFYDYDAEIDNELGGLVDSFGLNTKIKHVNLIDNYTCNKVLDNITFAYDKENGEHNYYAYDRSVLQMPTDNGIYKVYTDNDNYEHYSGYANGVRDKMMIASQCLLLKSDITIDSYMPAYVTVDLTTSLFNENEEAEQELEIQINATEHFVKYFNSNKTFILNFGNTPKYDINNYILQTISKYFDFNNIEIELYGKYNDAVLKTRKTTNKYLITTRPKDVEFINYELLTNYKTECIIDNDNVIIKLTIPYNKSYTYYPILKINRL